MAAYVIERCALQNSSYTLRLYILARLLLLRILLSTTRLYYGYRYRLYCTVYAGPAEPEEEPRMIDDGL